MSNVSAALAYSRARERLSVAGSGDTSIASAMLSSSLSRAGGWRVVRLPSASFSPDGLLVLTANSAEGSAKVWDARSGLKIFTLEGHADRLFYIGVVQPGRFKDPDQ